MGDDSPRCEPAVREASPRDIPVLAAHHSRMFAEIWQQNGESLDPRRAVALEEAYAAKLAADLATGICRAWVIEDRGGIVASGAISIASLVPTPADLSPKVAYLHSIYTEKPYRGRKYAQAIVLTILEFCRVYGIRRLMLNASDAGRSVYEKLGFRPVADMMRLAIT